MTKYEKLQTAIDKMVQLVNEGKISNTEGAKAGIAELEEEKSKLTLEEAEQEAF